MILITGASDGLGLELAKIYAKAGKNIVNLSRTESPTAAYNILTDLRDSAQIEASCLTIAAIDEPLEAIVHCAGIMSLQPLEAITPQELRSVIATNLESAILLTSHLAEKIRKDGTDIMLVASTVGHKGYVSQAAYGASKWALRGFSANLQAELKDTPSRVISFCPGGFKSKIFQKATGIDTELKDNEWMDPTSLAVFMKQILDLPKNMEVSEVVINRKLVK